MSIAATAGTGSPTGSDGIAGGGWRLCRYEFAPTALYQPQGGPVFLVVLGVPCQHDDLCLDAGDLTGLPVPQAEVPVGHLVVYVFRNDVFAALPRVRQS